MNFEVGGVGLRQGGHPHLWIQRGGMGMAKA